MRTARMVAGAALLVMAVTGCAGGAEGGVNGGASAPLGGKPVVKLTVPSAYDGARGWDETLGWVPASVDTLPFTVLPRSRAVALMYAASNGYTVRVRTADSGQTVWTSTPWNPPVSVEDSLATAGDGTSAEIPDVTTVDQDGRSYVIAYAHGMRGKDDLHQGTEVVQIEVYPADATGSSVQPLRQIDVPVTASPGQIQVQGSGGRLLVAWGESGEFPKQSAAVDVATGKVDVYQDPNQLLPQCAEAAACTSSRVIASTSDGPLVAMGGGGFGVPGHWFSATVRPSGVDDKTGILASWNGSVYGAAAGHVLADWNVGDDSTHVWSVHDQHTGGLQASVSCAYDPGEGSDASRDYPVITSPSGRYLAAGPVAFDLQTKKGICLQGDGNRKTIALNSIRDDGTAYGAVQQDASADDSAPVIAQVNLGTGSPQVLGAGTDVPYATDLRGFGLFLGRDNDKRLRVSLRRQH